MSPNVTPESPHIPRVMTETYSRKRESTTTAGVPKVEVLSPAVSLTGNETLIQLKLYALLWRPRQDEKERVGMGKDRGRIEGRERLGMERDRA